MPIHRYPPRHLMDVLVLFLFVGQIATPTPGVLRTPAPTGVLPTPTIAAITPTSTVTEKPEFALPPHTEVFVYESAIQYVTPSLTVWNGRILDVKVGSLSLRKRSDDSVTKPRWQWDWWGTCIAFNGVAPASYPITITYIPRK